MKYIPLFLACSIFSIVTALSEDQTESGVTVYLFAIPDCPIVNRYVPEINRIYDDYSGRGVEITLVYPDASLTEADIANHREEYSLKPVGILDPDRKLVELSQATITPEAVVFDSAGTIVYRGRIDDWFTDWGDRRLQPTERNLRLALDAVLADKEVEIKQSPAIGCFIE